MTPNPIPKMTLEEYFEFDKNSEGRFEYFDGTLFELSGVSPQHARLELQLAVGLSGRAQAKGGDAFPASLRIKPTSVPTYRYPDFSVACGEARFVTIGGLECLVNPGLIVEILSESTERFDRTGKFNEYKSIDSFTEYLLVSSTSIGVTLYQRQNDPFWFYSEYSAGQTLHLNTLDFDVNVDDLYRGVDFSLPTDE